MLGYEDYGNFVGGRGGKIEVIIMICGAQGIT